MTHRVAIVAASPASREAIASALADDPRWRVVTRAASAAEIDWQRGPPDIVVAELGDGADAAAFDDTPVVLLGDATSAITSRLLAERRPLGLLPRDAPAHRLRAAVAAVLEGLSVWQPSPSNEPPGEPLTPRELEVFELVAKGLSNPDIAGVLGISAHTAKFHVGQILAKIGAASRAEAVGLGLRLGLIGV